MLAAEVAVVRLHEGEDLLCADLAVAGGQGQHLVAGVLHGAGLVDVDVAALGADHALIGFQDGGDDGDVGLRAAHEEMHGGIGGVEHIADHIRGPGAMGIFAVSERLLVIRILQGFQDRRMAALQVVAFEKDHLSSNQKTVCKIHKKSLNFVCGWKKLGGNEKSRDSHRSLFSILTKIINQ